MFIGKACGGYRRQAAGEERVERQQERRAEKVMAWRRAPTSRRWRLHSGRKARYARVRFCGRRQALRGVGGSR